MPAQVSTQEIKQVIMEQLPYMLKTDPEIRRFMLNITREQYADKTQTDNRFERTEDRFDRMFAELKRDREENQRKWEENQNELKALRQESEKKWKENQKTIEDMLSSIKTIDEKQKSSIGALGARWGLYSEAAFRNGLKAIVEQSFGVTVERYQDFDHDGIVFGRPDQIELDVLIFNGTILLCELKSSISIPQMYAFWRKCQFYEQKHNRTVDRRLVISPMVEDRAKHLAHKLDIEVYDYADEVPVTREA